MIQMIYMKAKCTYINSYKNTKCSTPSILKWSKNNKYCLHYKWWDLVEFMVWSVFSTFKGYNKSQPV